MILALDSNILIDIWAGTAQGQLNSSALFELQRRGARLIVCGAVYAELHAYPGISRAGLDAALSDVNISIDPVMTPPVWEEVGRAHAAISERRRAAGVTQAKRPLADHIIGAHAAQRADALLTLNTDDYTDFVGLSVVRP